MILTYRYRLLPTRAQHGRLRAALEHSRQLYNAALEERIDCYRKTGKGRTYFDQTAALTQLRQDGTPYTWGMESAPLKALDLAYKAFFKRGGFPRFKGRDWFKTIAFADAKGWAIDGGKFRAKGIGKIRLHMHRTLPGKPKIARIKREGRHWYVSLVVEVECAAANDRPPVGIDAGLNTLAALSTGEMIDNARPYLRAMRKLRVKQRALARCKRGSKRRGKVKSALAAAHLKIRRTRDTHLHQVSASIANRFGMIAVEALNVKGLAASNLARSVNDASWTKLFNFLRYKAERAGGRFVEVDPRYTSQTCPECGAIEPKALSQREHRCPCGCVEDRDVAAAKVVLLRAVVQDRGEANVAGCGERIPGKVAA
ncbi:RNA-guided endonuclease TnpB family protein [Sphingopyxis sp. C-1]|uniref:RNA-guided endonuclease InsQ/TnpB family protein n=1 Tax=Sphingopyxis sp. C-1 TaxID=262667 RepID=UPI0006C1D4EE|nr:RNA-guided endonuclease TnpB family protein [Sphingopyxis sp. C-1]GAO78687.1 mobile element protein [Sphingopyxis sp. C-1]